MRLINTRKLVKQILEVYPETRDDDYLLWLTVLQNIDYLDCREYIEMPMGEFLKIAKYMKIPPFISVARARRKAQELYPELKGAVKTQVERAELEKRYRENARVNA